MKDKLAEKLANVVIKFVDGILNMVKNKVEELLKWDIDGDGHIGKPQENEGGESSS